MLPTRADFFNRGAEEVLARSRTRPPRQRITRDAIFTEGTDINIILASASAMADEAMRNLAARCGAFFVDAADGDDLDRKAADISPSLLRKPPTPAVVEVQFTRSAGSLPAVSLDVGTLLRTVNGTEFETTQVAALPAGSTGPVTATAQAVAAGLGGNVASGTITQFVQAPSDPNLQVTNPEVAAGGANRESDAAFRERIRDFFRTARRGILGAIEFGALTVAGVASARAIELLDPVTGLPFGRVQLLIADRQGQGNAVLVAAVQAALQEFRAAGIVVDVLAATPVFVPITYRLRFEAGTNTVAAAEEVRFVTVARVNVLRPQETLTEALLQSILVGVPGVIPLDDSVVAPVGDLVPSTGQILRTRSELVTFV